MYETLNSTTPLRQGEIIDDCPLLFWGRSSTAAEWQVSKSLSRIVILSQACDLESPKLTRVQVATVHAANALVESGVLNAQTIKTQLTRHRVFGWYFLPADSNFPESIIDLRDIHTIDRSLLEELAAERKRVCTLTTPYREHLAQHFAVTFSRIGLPEPYETER